jgi:hypothetical protein
MMLRQYVKLLGVSEEWLTQRFMKENVMKLGGFRFLTRPKSLDVLFFSSFYEPQTTTLINRMKGKVFLMLVHTQEDFHLSHQETLKE